MEALRVLQRAAPDRVGIYNLENADGVPIYVHAKVCVVDDIWFTCGSDNLSRRSWTSDSELTCAVVDSTTVGPNDDARMLAREFRLDVWAEHLGLTGDDRADPALNDPVEGFERWRRCADELDAWHASGERGARPPGQIRRHQPQPVSRLEALWARPLYRLIYDPDGQPRKHRREKRF